MVEADLFVPSTIRPAITGSGGVFTNTDYWTLLDKDNEITQGKNNFEACRAAGVHHVVFSTLPQISTLSAGKYTGAAHFESKAAVRDYIEAQNRGKMVVSYFVPAMYMENIKMSTQDRDGQAAISLPFADPTVPLPLLAPARDTGKYVLGLLDAGDAADGVAVQGVSAWTMPNEVARVVGERLGKPCRFNSIDGPTYAGYLPKNVSEELTEMMLWIGEASYYGKGTEKKQAESEKWLVKGETLTSWEKFAESDF